MVNIKRSGDSVLVTSFDNSQFPWSDGELSVPLNSMYFILEDETDFIVFKSIYDDSIMFTALIDEIHVNDVKVTRDTIIELVDNVINSNGGGSASAGVNSINGFQGDVNIKSINGESLIGSGDITISGGDVDLSDYYNKSEVDTITNSLVTNVAVMGGDRIAVIQKNGNIPQEIYFPTINGQPILGVEGNITIEGGSSGGGITEETDPIFEAWKNRNYVTLGNGATDSGEANGIVIGYNATGSNNTISIGQMANAVINSIAIGKQATTNSSSDIAIGNELGGVQTDSTYKINIGNTFKGDRNNYAYVLNEYGNYVRIPTEWTGTQSEYDALGTYYDNITYNIIEG